MKKRSIIAMTLAAAMVLGACGKTEETEVAEQTAATTTQAQTMIITSNGDETEAAGETEAAEPAGPVELTLDNYFDTDPAETEWGQGEGADIIDMVDLDYLEASQNAELFEVDTIEQFASLNYYVNTYPLAREYESLSDDHFFINVNINSDFDLSDYDWPSMGYEANNHEHSFAGIYIANGHTVTGLENSLFGDIYGSAVCGICLDAGVITDDARCLIADNIEDVRFFDCHISAVLEEGELNPEILFQIYSTDEVNRFLDCTIDVVWPDGETHSEQIQLNPYSTGANNAIMEFFDPDRDGVYEYGGNYFES